MEVKIVGGSKECLGFTRKTFVYMHAPICNYEYEFMNVLEHFKVV